MTTRSIPRVLEPMRCVWNAAALLGEGTCWSVREQALWWVDILGHRLHRYTPQTDERRTWTFDETISAVAERARGPGLIVALQHRFALFDPADGSLRRLHEPEPDRPRNRFNDGKCDARGRFWAGTMDFDCAAPTGALYRYRAAAAAALAADGFGICELALDARFAVTNGPTWSQDGRTMYFTDTVRGEIGAYAFDPESGRVGAHRPWLRFANERDGRPDGMTTDADGRIWIAHWGGSCVTCHEPLQGAELLRVAVPASQITNVAFGGKDLDTLFITSARADLDDAALRREPLAGGLFAVRTDARGIPAHLFAG